MLKLVYEYGYYYLITRIARRETNEYTANTNNLREKAL